MKYDDSALATREERAEVERRIERAVEEHRRETKPETLSPVPEKHDGRFPVAVNLIAVLVVLGGGLFLIDLFRTQEREIVAHVATITSAEGRLLSELRRESEERLSSKDDEIEQIERRLAETTSELEAVRAEVDDRVEERRAELERELDALFAAERSRLAAESLDPDEVETRLSEFRERQQTQLERDVARLEARLQDELASRETALTTLIAEYEHSLETALEERQAMEALIAERESELRRQYDRREQELIVERDAAQRRLRDLSAEQENRRLLIDALAAQVDEAISSDGSRDLAAQAAALESTVAQLLNRDRTVERGVESYRSVFDAQAQTEVPSQLELLEAKLGILRIASSRQVRGTYPDLYARINDYLDALAVAQEAGARREVLDELRTLVGKIESGSLGTDSARAATEYPALSAAPDATARLLDALTPLVAPSR
jgi:chromosome segregation ATPase